MMEGWSDSGTELETKGERLRIVKPTKTDTTTDAKNLTRQGYNNNDKW